MTEGFATYASYSNPALARPWAYLHDVAGVTPSRSDFIQLAEAVGAQPDRLKGLSIVWSVDPGMRVTELKSPADPRAFLAFRAETEADWREAARQASLDATAAVAQVERGTAPALPPGGGPASGDCAVTSFSPEEVRLRASAGRAAILVLGEAWYPGWTAAVNGRPTPVFPVDGWKRGVVVPAGPSDIVFTFRPGGLGLGAAISMASLCAVALVAGVLPRARVRPS
jgi:hypothetical protein